MNSTVKLFTHGRSQAVRLPREFRFKGTEVRISKVGDKVILEPLKKQPPDFEKFWAELDALGARDCRMAFRTNLIGSDCLIAAQARAGVISRTNALPIPAALC